MFDEKNMSDNWIKVNRKPTAYGGRVIIFGNNQNNTALIQCTHTESQKKLKFV